MVVSEKLVLHAIQLRSRFIRKQASKISMTAVRELLEQDLQLQPQQLKPSKKFIADNVLKVLEESAGHQGSDEDMSDEAETFHECNADDRPAEDEAHLACELQQFKEHLKLDESQLQWVSAWMRENLSNRRQEQRQQAE
ncbi:hypothetical protein WJX73_001038 [Symbiochloris irregularis]|uniref:Uncharacterized protein n=1 Tax=Symbiochloris irregularis TaxID=706552 RepID=A0AAW1PVL3_9CHLO